MENAASSRIYVIATPIGNLDDISFRAVRMLKEVDIIACEDTRVCRKLLSHLEIKPPGSIVNYSDPKEQKIAEKLVERLWQESLSLAIISDAGTPCISDPGYRITNLARKKNIPIYTIPGPSSLTALASISGLPTDRFLFIGFLPSREKELHDEIRSWKGGRASIIFFESARRIKVSVAAIAEAYPTALICLGRELTKMYEESYTLNIHQALIWLEAKDRILGEFVCMVNIPQTANKAKATDVDDINEDAGREFKTGASLKDLLQKYKDKGLSRSALYQLLLKAKGTTGE